MTTSESRPASDARIALSWSGRRDVNPQCFLTAARSAGMSVGLAVAGGTGTSAVGKVEIFPLHDTPYPTPPRVRCLARHEMFVGESGRAQSAQFARTGEICRTAS